MTLTLTFPPDIEAKLRQRAAASGKDIEAVVKEAVENIFLARNGNAGRTRNRRVGESWRASRH